MVVRLDEGIVFPRAAVRFPVELRQPTGMRPDDPTTWPSVDGRLELVGGRLLYMPPCADFQQDTSSDVTFLLRVWRESHPEYVIGSNEAGMILGGEVRGADAAVWRASDAGARVGRLRRVAPILAVEVAGEDEGEEELTDKARWYLAHGVKVVWLVFPRERQAWVVDAAGTTRYAEGSALPESPDLPGLAPAVERFFTQVSAGRA